MNPILNIGLNSNKGGKIPVSRALRELRANGASVVRHTLVQSDSEPTLVAELVHPLGPATLHYVSELLEQDCVAYVGPEGGALHGPDAAKWGAFNPQFFFTLAGERLAA